MLRTLLLLLCISVSWCSDVAVVTLGPVGGGSGGGGSIGGSIANGQVAVGTGSNQIGGSAALTFSAGTLSSNAALTIASPNLIMATENFDIEQSTNSILGIFAGNTSNGAAAKTQFTAANDVGDQLYFGITSSGFTGNARAAFLGSSVPFDIRATTEELTGALTITVGSGNGTESIYGSSGAELNLGVGSTAYMQLYGANNTFQINDLANNWSLLSYSPGARTAGEIQFTGTLDATSTSSASVVMEGGLAVQKSEQIGGSLTIAGASTIDGVLTAGGASAPSANTFTGNLIWGGNTAAAYTPGAVGEVIEQQITSSTNAASTGTYLALATITLSAGNWTINATFTSSPNGATFTPGTTFVGLIGTTSASASGSIAGYDTVVGSNVLSTGGAQTQTIGPKRVQIITSTPYYLNVLQNFTAGTPQWRGSITAIRTP